MSDGFPALMTTEDGGGGTVNTSTTTPHPSKDIGINYPDGIIWGDLDGDGKPEFFFGESWSQNTYIYKIGSRSQEE